MIGVPITFPKEPTFVKVKVPPEMLREAVSIRDARCHETQLEASGGVTLETVRAIAESGVERISIGSLTHSSPSLDLGFDWPW